MASTEKDQALITAAHSFDNVPWCEDYEKMISGMLYDPLAPELEDARLRARRFALRYNAYMPEDATTKTLVADRKVMLRGMLGKMGEKCYIEPPFFFDYGCNISLGTDFYANFNTVILDCGLVTIGDRVLFGPNVSLFAATHETEVNSRRRGVEFAKSIIIGSDCWIGGNVSVMPGVTIGDGCTVGAGSVVTRDIPPFSVAIGSPARVVKKVTPVPEMSQVAVEGSGDSKAT